MFSQVSQQTCVFLMFPMFSEFSWGVAEVRANQEPSVFKGVGGTTTFVTNNYALFTVFGVFGQFGKILGAAEVRAGLVLSVFRMFGGTSAFCINKNQVVIGFGVFVFWGGAAVVRETLEPGAFSFQSFRWHLHMLRTNMTLWFSIFRKCVGV
jgi:hypothetical protein